MTITLTDYCNSHTLPLVWVYHISGMDWCSTNSPELKTWLDSDTADVKAYKKLMFGSVSNDGATNENYSALDIKCIVNLDNDIGSQKINYKRDKGINVGNWNVTVTGGELGYQWSRTDVECWGIMGLDCQPDVTTPGSKSAVVSRDYQPNSTSFLGTLYWDKSRDNGLKSWIDAEISAGRTAYVWVGSSCLSIYDSTGTTGDEYYAAAQACQFNTPLELIHTKYQGQMITITNHPQSIAGMTASVYGVPFDKVGGDIIGEVTEKPFLLWYGKVQTNIKSNGVGQWKIGATGATDQFKFESIAAQTKATLHGFHFSRNTLATGNYDNYRRAQQPHLWVFETNTSSINSAVVEQGDFEASTLGSWLTGASTNFGTSSLGVRYGSVYGVVTCTAVATPAYIYQDVLVVGQRYKIKRGVARGDNAANPILKCGSDQVVWSGTTSTTWQPIELLEFVAEDTELRLYTNGALAAEFTAWDDLVISTATINVGELWLGNMSEGDSVRYETITEVKNEVITEMNRATAAGTLECQYQIIEGDLVFASPTTDTYSVQIFGPAVFVCGFGYLDIKAYQDAVMDMLLNNGAPAWSLARGNHWGGASWEEELSFEDAFGAMNFSKVPYWCHIRELSDTTAKSITETRGWLEYGVPVGLAIKNYSSCGYYYQWIFDETPWPMVGIPATKVPEDSSGNHRWYYSTNTDSNLEVGDVVNFGPVKEDVFTPVGTVSAAGTTGGLLYISTNYDAPSGSTGTDYTKGMPESIQWFTGWKDAFDSGFLSGILLTPIFGSGAGRFNWNDPYEIQDKINIQASNPIDIIKQLLGSYDVDTGVPRGMRCTTIGNLWEYHDGDRALVDWDRFESLVESAGMDGTSYKLTVPEGTDNSTSQAEVQTVNILEIINGICMTHGIKQCWEYNEEQRAWWLTFKPYFGDSLANASNEGRVLDSTQDVNVKPSGQAGGQWLYSAINLELAREDGGKEIFPVSKSIGRYKHSIGSKKLTIKDKLTTLPVSSDASRQSVINVLSNYINEFSTVHYQQKATAKLSALTRFTVGGGILVDLDHFLHRPTGKHRYGEQYGNVESLTINFGQQANISADLLTSSVNRTGIAPSMYFDTYTRASTLISVTGLATTNGDSYFVPSGGGLTDLSTFGCWAWSYSNNAFVAKDCSCANYKVWVIERDQESLTDVGASRNVWAATIVQPSASTIANGTAQIILVDNTNFPADTSEGRKFVVIFADRDTVDLQPCQYNLYGWLGDADGTVTDEDGNVTQAIVIGG